MYAYWRILIIMPGQHIPTDYLPILVLMIVATLFGLGALLVGIFFRPNRPYAEKLMPYESGNIPAGEPRTRFSVHFYIVAMLFLVFDVEAVFLYPWAVVFDRIGFFAYIEMVLFIIILLVGYIYAWKKDAFNWDK
jgi:NADH-quinone oxidoreductase subunit A